MVTTIRPVRGRRAEGVVSPGEGPQRSPSEGPIAFVWHPSFDDPEALEAIIGTPIEGPEPGPGQPVGPLDSDQEAGLFLRMNALKCRAEQIRGRIDPEFPDATEEDRVAGLLGEARRLEHRIILANRPLLSAIARRHARPSRDIHELIAEGAVPLIMAVEKFDVSRGFKFSTYATWAITHQLNRSLGKDLTHLSRFRTGKEEVVEALADDRAGEADHETSREQLREVVLRLLGDLEDRERQIVVDRFGLDGDSERSLRAIGKRLGVSGERVRQIERSARRKLLRAARRERLDLLFC
jgi:RNA polymerase sigma factor (sigma-70 family)